MDLHDKNLIVNFITFKIAYDNSKNQMKIQTLKNQKEYRAQ